MLLLLAGLVVVEQPPMIVSMFEHVNNDQDGPDDKGYDPDDPKRTIGMLAGVLGVTILGGLANVAISATGHQIGNGLLIFYGGFARFSLNLILYT